MKNVVREIPHDVCVGCGTCVGVCPMQHIEIGYDEIDRLKVIERDNACSDKCSVCTSVCPFSNNSNNEDLLGDELYSGVQGVRKHPACGYFLNSYVGFHPNQEKRLNSASGGLTSYVLAQLLDTQQVDAVIVVGRKEGNKPYYASLLARSSEEVYQCSRSAYYAVHIGETLREVIVDKSVTSVAIVALPCQCKAIRNACKENAILRRKVKIVIGLVCGQQKTHNFADYLGKRNGLSDLTSIDFRTKQLGRPNCNFGVRLKSKEKEKEITFSDYAKDWSFKLFTVQACNYCDDIFAECADMVVMDAWLPEYATSDKGENLIITRSAEMDSVIKDIPGIRKIGIERVLHSQAYVIQSKRSGIVVALSLLKSQRGIILRKRCELYKSPSILERVLYSAKYKMSVKSDRMWNEANKDVVIFNKKLRGYKIILTVGLILNKIHTIICQLKKK